MLTLLLIISSLVDVRYPLHAQTNGQNTKDPTKDADNKKGHATKKGSEKAYDKTNEGNHHVYHATKHRMSNDDDHGKKNEEPIKLGTRRKKPSDAPKQ